jgi:chromosome segregation ATPase
VGAAANEEVALSIVSRIFVVLVTILSVAQMAMIGPFIQNTENFRSQLELARQEKNTAEQNRALLEGEKLAVFRNQTQMVRDLRNETAQNLEKIGQLTGEKGRLEAEIERGKSAVQEAVANGARSTIVSEQLVAMNNSLKSELDGRRTEMVKQQTRLIELGEANTTLSSKLETFERQVRRFSEQMAMLEDDNRKLEEILRKIPADEITRAKGGTTDDTAKASEPFEGSVRINGLVTDVRKIDATTFVEVNLGKQDGLAENMKFLVHRGDQFIGTLVITNVDLKSAAGRMRILQGDVNKGDAVFTGPTN